MRVAAEPAPAGTIVLGIDPGERATGLAAWAVGDGRPKLVGFRSVSIKVAGFRDGDAVDALTELAGGAWWAAAIERPPPPKVGLRAAPAFAFRYWRRALELFARQRSAENRTRFRLPGVLEVQPGVWRAAIGVSAKDRPGLKLAAIERLKLELGPELEAALAGDDDAAEAALIGLWAARVGLLGRRDVFVP